MFSILLQLLCFCGLEVNIIAVVTRPNVIGRGYFLPDVSLEEGLASGRSIFNNYNETCIKTYSTGSSDQDKKYFQNTEEYYSFLASESSLSGERDNGYTLSVSLENICSSLRESNYTVKGMKLYVVSRTSEEEFLKDCLYSTELTEEFIKNFNELPEKITTPHSVNSWKKYDIFLKDYGSHIATRLIYGSKFSQNVFSSYKTDVSKNDFHIAACAQLTEAKTQIHGCANFTDEDYIRVAKLSISSQWKTKGGNGTTRTAFVRGVTDDRIVNFLNAARDADQSVEEKFMTMWDFLELRFQENHTSIRKIGLMKAYYEGYLSAGCSHKTYEGYEGRQHDLRRFVQIANTDHMPSFKCELAPVGCKSDKDCHNGASTSYCYGKSCIAEIEEKDTSSSVKTSRKIQLEYDGKSYTDGANYYCWWVDGGRCDLTQQVWEQTWPHVNSCHDNSCYDNNCYEREQEDNRRRFSTHENREL